MATLPLSRAWARGFFVSWRLTFPSGRCLCHRRHAPFCVNVPLSALLSPHTLSTTALSISCAVTARMTRSKRGSTSCFVWMPRLRTAAAPSPCPLTATSTPSTETRCFPTTKSLRLSCSESCRCMSHRTTRWAPWQAGRQAGRQAVQWQRHAPSFPRWLTWLTTPPSPL